MTQPPEETAGQFQIWRMDGETIEPAAPDALPADLVDYLRAEYERQNPPKPAPAPAKAASEPALKRRARGRRALAIRPSAHVGAEQRPRAAGRQHGAPG